MMISFCGKRWIFEYDAGWFAMGGRLRKQTTEEIFEEMFEEISCGRII